MSDRTVIGGTSYEAVGSSSSNLLLKCNGTARIQWGNKLIDLIKNGKLAAENQEFIFNISDESEIKLDGIYILSTEETSQLWACKKGLKHNLTEANLYISAGNKLEITAELKTQALQNIGMYYNTLEEAKNSGMKNGIVYIVETQSLYTIKEGEFKIFEGSATITVEDDNTEEGVINGSLKIVLSVGGFEYMVLQHHAIRCNKPIMMHPNALICSEGADEYSGYRLYMSGDKSCLEIDKIYVRDSEEDLKEYLKEEFISITFELLLNKINSNKLIPHKWYKLTDFKNPWRNSDYQSRPILIRALTPDSLYEYGYLYDNLDVVIKYDYTYQISILYLYGNENITTCPDCGDKIVGGSCSNCDYLLTNSEIINTKGKITWMKDLYGNEANFDFLDYLDLDNLNSKYYNYRMPSIFPLGSTNNKILVSNLKGTEFKLNEDGITHSLKTEGVVLQFGRYEESSNVNPQLEGEDSNFLKMNNNTLVINGNFTINESCVKFNNNTINNIVDVSVNGSMENNKFSELKNCTLNANFSNTSFKAIEDVTFEVGELKNITCEDDYRPKPPIKLNSEKQELLYNPREEKLVYVNEGILLVESLSQQKFSRGMIMMHSGLTAIPSGWAICDGTSVNYNGELITTPNLVNRFIKAVNEPSLVGEWNNYNNGNSNDFKLLQEHLPSHSHPHAQHTHTISGLIGTIENSGNLTLQLSNNNYINSVSKTTTNVVNSIDTADIVYGNTTVIDSVSSDTLGGTAIGGNHTHNLTISGGTISNTESTEQKNTTWTNLSFKIEPNYYSLIFIMKL